MEALEPLHAVVESGLPQPPAVGLQCIGAQHPLPGRPLLTDFQLTVTLSALVCLQHSEGRCETAAAENERDVLVMRGYGGLSIGNYGEM